MRTAQNRRWPVLLPALLLALGLVAGPAMAADPAADPAAEPTSAAAPPPLLQLRRPATPAATATPDASVAPAAASQAPGGGAGWFDDTSTRALDEQIQDLKQSVVDLNKDLFVLEEELLFPANTQVAVFVSMDVGEFFGLDSVTLKIDNREVSNYLYTPREVAALLKGGVQRLYVGNLKAGTTSSWRCSAARARMNATTAAARRSSSRRVSAQSTWSSRFPIACAASSRNSRSRTGSSAPMRRLEALILLLLGGALASSAAWSAHRAPDTLPKQTVQDLHYGDVLFRFYAGDTWGALDFARGLRALAAHAAQRTGCAVARRRACT